MEVGCQEGEMLLVAPQRQNQVGTKFTFCACAHGDSGFCELLPLLVVQKNMQPNNVVFLVDKVCCTTLVLSRIQN
jgi:hypothetical protein